MPRYNNVVRTAHGQELGRKSDTEYTHAVIHTTDSAGVRSRLTDTIAHLEHTIANIDDNPAYVSRLKKAQRELAALPEEGPVSSLVSMHTSSAQAEGRRRRESNRGVGYTIVPVTQG